MALQNYLWPKVRHFDVICKDNVMQITGLTVGKQYTVLGMIQDFYIMIDDKGVLAKYYKDRFKNRHEVVKE